MEKFDVFFCRGLRSFLEEVENLFVENAARAADIIAERDSLNENSIKKLPPAVILPEVAVFDNIEVCSCF